MSVALCGCGAIALAPGGVERSDKHFSSTQQFVLWPASVQPRTSLPLLHMFIDNHVMYEWYVV